jgi:hypothetical protein
MRLPALFLLACTLAHAAPSFQVRFPESLRSTPIDGRLILIVSTNPGVSPRQLVSWSIQTAQVFGVDVNSWRPGEVARIDASAAGHPLPSLRDLAPGKYQIQAVLHVYETVRRAGGHTLKLPWDDGEGQQWDRSPGNLLSSPQSAVIRPDSVISVELSSIIPPIDPPKDTKYVRHVRMQSELLTKFWGRPVFIGAHVLVPEGFDEHPERRYPVAYNQGHFPSDFRAFRDTPPDSALKGPALARAQALHRFYQEWTSGRLPKFLIVLTQHATPFYDDSYGLNTANMGPYGDALTQEFYPWLEKKFHAIGQSWAGDIPEGQTLEMYYLPIFAKHIRQMAPKDADLDSWR